MLDSSHLIYAVAGALSFATLGAVAAYYRDDSPSKKSVARDFVAGSLIVTFVMTLMPGLFPEVNFKVPLPDLNEVLSRDAAITSKRGGGHEYELQF